jgi:small-conductance mechanosensitive channel
MLRDLSIVIAWAIIGVGLSASLQIWDAGPGLKDLVRTALVGVPTYVLFAGAVWRHERILVAMVAGRRPRSRLRSRIAKSWPALVIALLALTFFSTQVAFTMGSPLPPGAVVLTILLFVATPHLDALIERWAHLGLDSTDTPVPVTAGRQTARFAMLIVTMSMLGTLWATPLALGFGFELQSVAHEALGIALIALLAAFLWNVVGTMTERAMRHERSSVSVEEERTDEGPRSRLGTIIPLLTAVGKSSILALAFVSIMVLVGVNVWPLITGLSVFGLAIGFGSQTLVKDIVSGLFFLIDDAFRFGEYIETSGAKGTVEKISVRSVSLRNSGGSIATVPYGQIGKIQNFSRDWSVEKLTFRVPFDTDVGLISQIFKDIGNEIAADPELAGDLLEPLKSQGISEVEDGTLVIKAKFKVKPGKESAIRRATLNAVQIAFQEHAIYPVSKPSTLSVDAPLAA